LLTPIKIGREEQGIHNEDSQESNKAEEQGEDLATIWQHHLASKQAKNVNSVR